MPHARGADHPRAQLTDDQVEHMRTRRERDRWPYSQVAAEVGCSIWTARDICDYRTRAIVKLKRKAQQCSLPTTRC
jgi:hypothetical protein